MSVRTPAPVRATAIAAVALLSARLAGCTCGEPPPPPDEPDAVTLALSRDVPFEIELPASSRPHAQEPPLRIPLRGWRGTAAGAVVPTPVRSRNLYFFKPNVGMRMVRADGTEIPHDYFAGPTALVKWTSDADSVTVSGLADVPGDDELFLEWPLATERERGLNLGTSGLQPEAFARTSIQSGATARHGLLLPAPGHVAWRITVPPRAELRFGAGLVLPEVADGPPSDGATVVVDVEVEGTRRELWRGDLQPAAADAWSPITVDLRDLAGKDVVLHARSEAGAAGDPRFDYVFLSDPVVATRRAHPHRVVMVFVDTLRPDHLSAFGYDRPTTPSLEGIADAGVRFTNARSIAPWTLPSSRTMLTGVDPEQYFEARTLQDRLATAGFATAMFAGNIYLTANFGITRDWGLHEVELLPRAETQVDKALAWLDEQQGRDAFLLLHLMDCHLPYEEPQSYRDQFVRGDLPPGFKDGKFHRQEVFAAHLDEAGRQYVRDRYDASIRYVDDQLQRVWERLGPDDTVVFLSDHGEEFWDHNGFEHGHALWDELLRFPLIVRGRGLPEGATVDAPVSMLDVTPTILDLVGVDSSGTKGTSLLKAAKGDPQAIADLRLRDQAFGRPLYGRERWGVLHQDLKYQVVGAKEDVYDLGEDPTEHTPLKRRAELPELRGWLGTALGREVVPAYRVAARGQRRVEEDLVLEITVPGGVKAAWVGDDPTEASFATVEQVPGGQTVRATWPAPYRGSRDVWFVPVEPLEKVTHGLKLHAVVGAATSDDTVAGNKPAKLTDGQRPPPLLKVEVGTRAYDLGFGVTPLPGDGVRLSGHDPEMQSALEQIGYVTGGAGDKAAPPAAADGTDGTDDDKRAEKD
jgi:arylsulfatase A-like enzyme